MAKISFADINAPTPTPDGPPLALGESAAVRIAQLLKNAKDKGDEKYFRAGIKGGGCNGYSYIYKLEAEAQENDVRLTHPSEPNVVVLVDPESFAMLRGATLEYEETLAASQFVMRNPNAKSSCGCGSSFSF